MSLTGRLDDVPIADLLQFVALARKSGTLFITTREKSVSLSFREGQITRLWDGGPTRLSDLLRSWRVAPDELLDQAISGQQTRPLSETLVEAKVLSRQSLDRLVTEHVTEQVLACLTSLAQQAQGSFEFSRIAELDSGDGFDSIPHVLLETELVLLRIAQAQDEAARDFLAAPAVRPRAESIAPVPVDRAAHQEWVVPDIAATRGRPSRGTASRATASRGVGLTATDDQTPLSGPSIETDLKVSESEGNMMELLLSLSDARSEAGRMMRLYVAIFQLHASLDPSEVQAAIRDIAVNLLGAEQLALLLRSDDDGGYEVALQEGVEPTCPLATGRYLGGMSMIDSALRDAVTSSGSTTGAPVRAAIPLCLEGQTVGVLVILKLLDHKPTLTGEDIELMNLLSGHAASALHAANLHAATARKLQTHERMVKFLLRRSDHPKSTAAPLDGGEPGPSIPPLDGLSEPELQRRALLADYRALTGERIQRVQSAWAKSENGPLDYQGRSDLIRELYTMKSEAFMLGFEDVGRIIERMETLTKTTAGRGFLMPPAAIGALLAGVPVILELVKEAQVVPAVIEGVVRKLERAVELHARESSAGRPHLPARS